MTNQLNYTFEPNGTVKCNGLVVASIAAIGNPRIDHVTNITALITELAKRPSEPQLREYLRHQAGIAHTEGFKLGYQEAMENAGHEFTVSEN